jgi:hypothetical protein
MSKEIWLDIFWRAIKTMCQTAVALVGTNAIGVTEVDWLGVLSGAVLAGILCILTNIAANAPTGE